MKGKDLRWRKVRFPGNNLSWKKKKAPGRIGGGKGGGGGKLAESTHGRCINGNLGFRKEGEAIFLLKKGGGGGGKQREERKSQRGNGLLIPFSGQSGGVKLDWIDESATSRRMSGEKKRCVRGFKGEMSNLRAGGGNRANDEKRLKGSPHNADKNKGELDALEIPTHFVKEKGGRLNN